MHAGSGGTRVHTASGTVNQAMHFAVEALHLGQGAPNSG